MRNLKELRKFKMTIFLNKSIHIRKEVSILVILVMAD